MGKKRMLHCVIDEKFIDGAITLFEEDSRVENTYVRFVKSTPVNEFRFIRDTKVVTKERELFFDIVSKYDVVVLHSLFSIPIDMIPKIPSGIKVVWLMWGYDFYNYQVYNLQILGPLSCKTLTNRDRVKSIRDFVKYWAFERNNFKKALYRIDFFSGVFPYEYKLLRDLKRYPDIKAKPIDFYYGSTSFFVPETPNLVINNQTCNVIIGNSADPSNNTLEVIEILKGLLDITSVNKIIVPLSYGTNQRFIQSVRKRGREEWGDKFYPLDHYLPLDKYLEIVSNCKVAIYFHERQQASDNVLMQLLYGAKVYMSSTSKMYQYLKEIGFHIYSLQEDNNTINEPISSDEIINNRILLSKMYSSSKLIERVKVMNTDICNL